YGSKAPGRPNRAALGCAAGRRTHGQAGTVTAGPRLPATGLSYWNRFGCADRRHAMRIDDVRRVLVIGSGTMGLQIGLQAATHGYDVVMYDVSQDALEAVPRRLRSHGEDQVAAGAIDAARLERALSGIRLTTDPASAEVEVDLVSESLPEDPALKGSVLGEFDELCPPRAVFTTNTSTLLPSMYAAATGRADRFAALHFHTPVWQSNVMGIFKMPIGPFGMLDGVGLDTVWHITDYWATRTGDAQTRTNADFIKAYVD